MADWYFIQDDRQVGPVALEQLQQAVSTGQVLPTDLVWHSGMADWLPVKKVPELGGGKKLGLFGGGRRRSPPGRDSPRAPRTQKRRRRPGRPGQGGEQLRADARNPQLFLFPDHPRPDGLIKRQQRPLGDADDRQYGRIPDRHRRDDHQPHHDLVFGIAGILLWVFGVFAFSRRPEGTWVRQRSPDRSSSATSQSPSYDPAMAFLTARWSNLCLFTYAVPPALLRPRVPPGLELDRREGLEGEAFVSLVAFDFLETQGARRPLAGLSELSRDQPAVLRPPAAAEGRRASAAWSSSASSSPSGSSPGWPGGSTTSRTSPPRWPAA